MAKVELDEKSFDNLKNHLLTMRNAAIIPSGRELKLSCPYCGDSRSDPYAASFYINIDINSENFLMYNCFRANCGVRGIVDEDFLRKVGFSSSEAINKINDYLYSKSIKVGGKYVSRNAKKLYNVENDKTELNDKKLKYFNRRLGTNLGYSDLAKLKVNLSLKELYSYNNMEFPKNDLSYYEMLNLYGIVFISAYNDYAVIRDTSKSGKLKKRYTNLNIFNNYDNVTKLFIIPCQLDLLSPDVTVLNIAEGVFDIFGVYFNLNIDREYDNQLFVAVCGAGIVKSIISIIKEYGLLNCKINIFSDSDVPKEKYDQLKKLKKYLNIFDITIYYNEKEKDFGVPKSQISLIHSKL